MSFLQLKKDYVQVRKLRDRTQPGFGWDEALQLVTAPDEIWEAIFQVILYIATFGSPIPVPSGEKQIDSSPSFFENAEHVLQLFLIVIIKQNQKNYQ